MTILWMIAVARLLILWFVIEAPFTLILDISVPLLVTILVVLIQDFYIVISDSMIPTLNTGDIALLENDNDIRGSSFANLNLGDIIVFEVSSDAREFEGEKRTIIHRVEEIVFDSDG